jgi:glycosyltransferase involved in cell wall biosynthesis
MKVAIVHDWLTGMRGGEKCLEIFCELFPEATIFTLLHNKGSVSEAIEKMKIKPSFIQHLPNVAAKYRHYLPLFPRAIESFDLRGFDLVLSSSHCAAKGARIPQGAVHICYCYTPMRYAWVFFDEYFNNANPLKRNFISMAINSLKKWDLKTNESVDFFVAISDNVKNRIKRFYGRDADVIYPPVDAGRFKVSDRKGDFYLTLSALVPYKRIDIAIEAFNASGKRLLIVGSGDSEKELKKKARPNIEFSGWADNGRVEELYSNCQALIFPGEEDFGIVPVEAQACGKPVIAYKKGGALETVIPINGKQPAGGSATGVFFDHQTPEALLEAVDYFESVKDRFDPQRLRENAMRFDREIFKKNIREYINNKLQTAGSRGQV